MLYCVAYFVNDTFSHIDDIFKTEDKAKVHANFLNYRRHGGYYSVIRLMILPPDGWSAFGTHLDYGGEIEFTKELDFEGHPIGERPRLDKRSR